MENGVVTETEEGSPQGGNLSPLLANVYLNEFDWEFHRRGVPCIRYTDDIVLLAKSERAAERLLESSTKYLEETPQPISLCTSTIESAGYENRMSGAVRGRELITPSYSIRALLNQGDGKEKYQ